jgi:hypothetical protein
VQRQTRGRRARAPAARRDATRYASRGWDGRGRNGGAGRRARRRDAGRGRTRVRSGRRRRGGLHATNGEWQAIETKKKKERRGMEVAREAQAAPLAARTRAMQRGRYCARAQNSSSRAAAPDSEFEVRADNRLLDRTAAHEHFVKSKPPRHT